MSSGQHLNLTYQNNMKILSVFFLLCCVSSTVEHSVEFFITASYGLPGFPEFVAAAVVDGIEFAHCDNKTLQFHEWTREFTNNYQDRLKLFSEECLIGADLFRASISDIMQLFNQSEGVHILQSISGCEWDEETGGNANLAKTGYNGEDFLTLDLQTQTWTALKPEALPLKLRGEADKAALYFMNQIYNHDCPTGLKETVTSGGKFLQRKVLPSVSLLQKSPSSPVSCFATGFYPDRAAMFWRKDGEELYEGVDHGEILSNNDQTYQMSADLNISSVKPGDWRRYECVFQLSGVKEDIITRLDKSMIRSNSVPDSPPRFPVVIGVAAGLLLLSVCITGFIMWRKKKNGLQAVQREQDNPETVLDSSL
ncbi:major histocompatibility complex class I-related gene protein-like [Cheilinus undulatus]|uniref:major histocompatibility complex class I-related gene protein-like n=1 Tax=Cheilinus undulatus TaxID=241271 RepID=UPI001BD2DF54|nr:major histocompatibility complex class I-related gene protein-like [Cheilinus undulatus]